MIFKNQIVSDEEKWIFNCFLFPLLEMFLFFTVSTYFFLAKIPITAFNLIICYLMGLAYLFFSDRKNFMKSLIYSTFLLLVPIFFCNFIWDYSWDGNAYHKLCVGLLKNGWNPVYQTIYTVVDEAGVFSEGTANEAFCDGYPKASYIISAVIYAFTGKIETGKAYNLLAMISSFGIIYFIGQKALSLKKIQAGLLAFVLCCNTVTVSQSITYYNDSLLQSLVFIVCAGLFYLYKTEERQISIIHLIISISIIIGVNLKYSAMLLFFLPCLVYFVYIFIAKREEIVFTVLFYSVIVFGALIVFGLTSYVHNTIFYHNPLYTLIGEGKEDVLSPSIPFAYREISNIFRILCSIFSPYSNNHELERISLKIPFTFSLQEIKTGIIGCDTRMGGWGIFYSGIFCTSFIVFIYRLFTNKIDKLNRVYLILLLVSFIPALFINCLNNARYWPFLFFIPIWLLYVVYDSEIRRKRAVVGLIICLSVLNIVPAGGGYLYCCYKTYTIKKEIKQKLAGKTNNMKINFAGFIYNLWDTGIMCTQKDALPIENFENVLKYSGIRVYY